MDLWLSPHDARIRSLLDGTGGPLRIGYAETPIGDCAALFRKDHLVALRFVKDRNEGRQLFLGEWPQTKLILDGSADRILTQLMDAPLSHRSIPVLAFGTPFQLSVWERLRRTDPVGTMTYGELARAIGRPSAARAVGRAVGANGIAVAIPCHRVVSRHGLTGYRWGVERKRRLLEWELFRRDPLKMPF
jgi:AraC family transcriptional regulator of adaptative response/methylated-DNA-[protein]-cysteine methyltransferase